MQVPLSESRLLAAKWFECLAAKWFECLAARPGGKITEKDWRQVRFEKVWRQIQIVGGASSVNFSDSARMHSMY